MTRAKELNYKYIKHEVQRLSKLEAACARCRRRFAFYKYLTGVYRLYRMVKRRGQIDLVSRFLTSLFDVRMRSDSHLIRILIDATSGADSKMKSRFALALRLLDREKISWQNADKHLRKWGGVAGCAEMHATWSVGRVKGRKRWFGPDGRLTFETGG